MTSSLLCSEVHGVWARMREFDKEKIAEFFNDVQATILVNSEKDEG